MTFKNTFTICARCKHTKVRHRVKKRPYPQSQERTTCKVEGCTCPGFVDGGESY